jgi:hypothetical protein
MAKDYGPWVRHDWCPRCFRRTEQTRWYRRLLGEPPEQHQRGIRCNECAGDVGLVAS